LGFEQLLQVGSGTKTILGGTLLVGDYLFWRDTRTQPSSIYGYDLNAQTEFLVSDSVYEKTNLTGDGTTLVWFERTAINSPLTDMPRIQSYDIATRTTSTIVTFSDINAATGLSLHNGILYYNNSTPEYRGLLARTIATGQEQLVSAEGYAPLAADGVLLWLTAEYVGIHAPAKVSLHMRKLDGSVSDAILMSTDAGYTGMEYDVDGDNIVWAADMVSGDARVYLYRISTGVAQPISAGPATMPVVKGSTVAWKAWFMGAMIDPVQWSVESYDLSSNIVSTVVAKSTTDVHSLDITNQGKLALSVKNTIEQSEQSAYMTELSAREVNLPAPVSVPDDQLQPAEGIPEADAAQPSCTTDPLSCRQVYKSGNFLFDQRGRWKLKGVQFFLPQYGINEKTFHDGNYKAAVADGSLNYWLGKADSLEVNMLRLFIELPSKRSDGTIKTPTSHETVYDFALKAKSRGMRLGLSLHNSADWAMTTERKNWIWGLLDYFKARKALPLIVYLNADNEINNHCNATSSTGAKLDCYDLFDNAYVNQSIDWVAAFRAAVKTSFPEMLITVGMSTEMADADSSSPSHPSHNYFKKKTNTSTSLSSLVDFLSPHNYGGGAWGVLDEIRNPTKQRESYSEYPDYLGPVVLEEYGFATDPVDVNNPNSLNFFYREGIDLCYPDNNRIGCFNTASWFIVENIKAVRFNTANYAGASAWMLADMKEKDARDACTKKPFDLWTGLFAIGGTYCGGTINTSSGSMKNTGKVILEHHKTY
jgi:hypothetical protein